MFLFLIPALFYQDWVIVYGKSVYWQMWSWFAPLVFNLYFLKNVFKCNKKCLSTLQYIVICSVSFILIYLKCLMGYEYISTVLIALVLPFIYYAVLNKLNIFKFVLPIAIIGILAFLFALTTHYLLLQTEVNNPKDILTGTILKRTYDFDLSSVRTVFHESLKSSAFTVVKDYIFGSRGRHLREVYLLFLCFLAILYSWKTGMIKNDRKCLALLTTLVVSAAGPLSWYTLAKGHSFTHHHMNYVLWYLPLNYLIYIFILYTLSPFLEKNFEIKFQIKNKIAQ